MADLEHNFEAIEQELLPMIASMLDSLLAAAQGASHPAADFDYAEQLQILAEKSDVMARSAIATALAADSPLSRTAHR